MMSPLASTTCDLHRQRPAAARCPGCQLYFCDECITEHDGQLSCAQCLDRARSAGEPERTDSATGRASGRQWLLIAVQALMGLVLCWALYYSLGRLLMAIPANFHDGTLWQE